jgi:hypothetical protein
MDSKVYRFGSRIIAPGILGVGLSSNLADVMMSFADPNGADLAELDASMDKAGGNAVLGAVELTAAQERILNAGGDGTYRTGYGAPVSDLQFSKTPPTGGVGLQPYAPGAYNVPIGTGEAAYEYMDDPWVGYEYALGETQTVKRRRRRNEELSDKQLMRGQTPTHIDTYYDDTPMYRKSDVDRVLGSLTPDRLAAFQAKAITAGLIDPDNSRFVEGWFHDEFTRSAMETVMYRANRSPTEEGANWEYMIEELARLQFANELEKGEDDDG